MDECSDEALISGCSEETMYDNSTTDQYIEEKYMSLLSLIFLSYFQTLFFIHMVPFSKFKACVQVAPACADHLASVSDITEDSDMSGLFDDILYSSYVPISAVCHNVLSLPPPCPFPQCCIY